jgi:hypothetical protein
MLEILRTMSRPFFDRNRVEWEPVDFRRIMASFPARHFQWKNDSTPRCHGNPRSATQHDSARVCVGRRRAEFQHSASLRGHGKRPRVMRNQQQ